MITDQLNIAAVQSRLVWHQPDTNFKQMDELVSNIKEADLIVLPEMWASGFTMKAEKYHTYADEAVALMKNWSESTGAALLGSLIVKEDASFYNRMFYVLNGHVEAYYDKRHLFGYAGEDRYFERGTDRLIIELNGWKIFPNICYDLRFPVWCRNIDDYDLLVFSANWPNPRIEAWKSLLVARAIENQCYVVGVNCVGTDAWKNEYSGHSAIIDYQGHVLDSRQDECIVLRQAIKKSEMMAFREKLPFLKDRDSFNLN